MDTTVVGKYPDGKSFYGAYDMAGNVWEWVNSLYKPYPYNASDGRENLNSKESRLLRGGSWYDYIDRIRTTGRNKNKPDIAYYSVGFRCARSQP
jgi:formylglycine-generating enzyme required for sulfatase activity